MAMSETTEESQFSGPGASPHEDLTGQDQLSRNVLASWMAHLVLIVGGFLMPRLIDSRLGQSTLGIWDFGWALVSYLTLVTGGVMSSVNRYVSQYRATGEIGGVNRAASSAMIVLLMMAIAAVVMTVACAVALPYVLSGQLGRSVRTCQWIVFLLGLTVAVEIAFAVYTGIITGCHRWVVHSAIDAGIYAAILVGMLGVVLLGGGLPMLALANLCGSMLGWGIRCFSAYRVCPDLHIRVRYVKWSMVRELLTFGGKSFVPHVGELVLNQTCLVLIMVFMGPATVAIFSRSRALVKHVRLVMQKYAFVFTPTASSLHAMRRPRELQSLMTSAVRSGLYIVLPMILCLIILGGQILRIWMKRPSYDVGLLLPVLAAGYLAMIVMRPVLTILAGLNAHGRPGLASLIGAITAIGLVALVLGPIGGGLTGVAIAISVPMTLVNAMYVPVYACRTLGIPFRKFVMAVAKGPILCAIPYVVCLITARLMFPGNAVCALLLGFVTGGPVLALLYWRFALSPSMKRKLPWPLRGSAVFHRTGL